MNRVCLFFMFLYASYAHAYEAYVSTEDQLISIIDTKTNSVTATISLTDNPNNIAFAPNGNIAYASLAVTGQVAIINAVNHTVIAYLTVGTNPQGIAVTPDGKKVFVVNAGSNNISVIDTAINIVTNTISLPPGSLPTNIVITPDGKAYVTDQTGYIFVIDAVTETVIKTITTQDLSPWGVGITPNGIITVATQGPFGDVLFIDPNTYEIMNKISGVISSIPEQFIFIPRTTLAYVTDDNAFSLFRFDWSTQKAAPLSLVLSSGFATNGGASSPDIANFYVSLTSSRTNNTVAILNAINNKNTQQTITVGQNPTWIAFRPTINLSVKQKKNDFAVIYELYNRLQWTLISNTPAAGFRIYRDDTLIATVDGSTFSYEDHNRQKNVSNRYLIKAFDANGIDIISSSEVLIK